MVPLGQRALVSVSCFTLPAASPSLRDGAILYVVLPVFFQGLCPPCLIL